MLDRLKRLFAHMAWADGEVLTSLKGSAASPPPLRAQEIYAHVLGAEHVWLSRLRQVPPRHPVWPTFDPSQCQVLAADNTNGFSQYLGTLTLSALAAEIPYVNSAGQSFRSRVDDILFHVALHGSYHRGQVALLVRAAGNKPAPTDYIGFVRGVSAATRQDER